MKAISDFFNEASERQSSEQEVRRFLISSNFQQSAGAGSEAVWPCGGRARTGLRVRRARGRTASGTTAAAVTHGSDCLTGGTAIPAAADGSAGATRRARWVRGGHQVASPSVALRHPLVSFSVYTVLQQEQSLFDVSFRRCARTAQRYASLRACLSVRVWRRTRDKGPASLATPTPLDRKAYIGGKTPSMFCTAPSYRTHKPHCAPWIAASYALLLSCGLVISSRRPCPRRRLAPLYFIIPYSEVRRHS